MVGLLDIGPLTRPATVRGVIVSVSGIGASGLFELMDQFPEIRKLFSNSGKVPDVQLIISYAPGAIATIIAYVCGYRKVKVTELGTSTSSAANEEYDNALAAASRLTLGEQTEIISTAWDLTFPKGVVSFFEALEAMGVATAPIKGQGTTSPEQLKNSLPQDTDQKTSGTTPQDS